MCGFVSTIKEMEEKWKKAHRSRVDVAVGRPHRRNSLSGEEAEESRLTVVDALGVGSREEGDENIEEDDERGNRPSVVL